MRSYISPVSRVDLARVHALFAEMEEAARSALAGGNGRRRRIRFDRMVALCYPGQTFDMPVPLATKNTQVTTRMLAETVERFHRLHEELHTYACRDEEPILRGLRLKAVAMDAKPALPRPPRRALGSPRLGARRAYFNGHFIATPIYDGPRLTSREAILGPAIIEEPFTTIVIYPGQRATVDAFGNYTIAVGKD